MYFSMFDGLTKAGVASDPAPLQHAAYACDACWQHKPRSHRERVSILQLGEVIISLRRASRIGEARLHASQGPSADILPDTNDWSARTPGGLRWRAVFNGAYTVQGPWRGKRMQISMILEYISPPKH